LQVSSGAPDEPGIEAFRRRAYAQDGREIVTLRGIRFGDRWTIECDVHPETAAEGETVRPGPYAFTSERAARAFADEATLALEFLGCEIA
jgi:hypothetical protein